MGENFFEYLRNFKFTAQLTKYNLRQGEEQFLNERLEQLRMLDRQGWGPI